MNKLNSLAFYQAAMNNNLPVAFWQSPHGGEKQAIVTFSQADKPKRVNLEEEVPGFVFSPFVNRHRQSTIFLRADLHLTAIDMHYLGDEATLPQQAHFLTDYHTLLEQPPQQHLWHTSNKAKRLAYYNEAEFRQLVQQAVDYIHDTNLQKIVASRAIKAALPDHFNPMALFDKLCQAYPHAFVSLVSIPDVGTWLGATPEILLTIDNNYLRTIALAGTQKFPVDKPLAGVTWGNKEQVEQALVSDYVRDFLQKSEVDEFTEAGPQTMAAGNVVHLQTDFTVPAKPNRTALLRLGNQILDSLHPTSAVCGMPMRDALDFILTHEGYDREFYAGFLGPVAFGGESSLFVNLRCMQLLQDSIVLYAGAGITPDSNPQAEWDETSLKAQTLLSILNLN